MKKIDQYIISSRRLKNNFTKKNRYINHYNLYSELISDNQPPILHLTYSSISRCEHADIGGEKYLIYDQNLGYNFNKLNSILFDKNFHTDIASSFFCKYLTQQLIGLNALEEAYAFGYYYENHFAKKSSCKETIKLYRSILPFTDIQEQFVIAHELSHHFMPELRIHMGEILDILEHQVEKGIIRKMSDSEIDEYANQYNIKNYEIESIKASREKAYNDLQSHWKNCKNRITEESLCDYLATSFATEILLDEYDYPPSLALSGLMLSFRYCRLFVQLDKIAKEIKDAISTDANTSKESAFNKETFLFKNRSIAYDTQIRGKLLYFNLWNELKERYSNNDCNKINMFLSDKIDMFDERVSYPLEDNFLQTIPSMLVNFYKAHKLIKVISSIDGSYELKINTIEKMINWNN